MSKGMTGYIYRAKAFSACSLNGVSSRYERVCVTGVRAGASYPAGNVARAVERGSAALPRSITPGEDMAEVELVVRDTGKLYVHAEPIEGAGRWAMFGGCYIDGDFSGTLHAIYGDRLIQTGPIPLHDRYE